MSLPGVVQVGWVVRNYPGDYYTLITRWHFDGIDAFVSPEQLVEAYPECEITWAEFYERFPGEWRPSYPPEPRL